MRKTILGANGIRHYVSRIDPFMTESGCGLGFGGTLAADEVALPVTCLGCLAWDPEAEEREMERLRRRWNAQAELDMMGDPVKDDDESA